MPKVELGSPAPELDMDDFTGRRIRLSEFRGEARVLLVFNRGFT